MKYTYILTGIKRDLTRFGMDCDWKGYIVGVVGGGRVAIHSSKLFIYLFSGGFEAIMTSCVK